MIIILCGITSPALACTTILVGKDASADGCAYAGRTNDDTTMLSAKLAIFPASDGAGSYEYVDPENGLTVSLPKANHRCIIEPVYNDSPDIWWESGFNDAGVGISATETLRINQKVLAIDPFTECGMSEGNIPRLVLSYINSAREGIFYLGNLVEQYGMTPYATDVVGNTRPIAIDRTGQSHFFMYKKGSVPIMWCCLTAPEFGVYLPVYSNVASLPDGLTVSTPEYDEKSFSWQLRLISDLAASDRTQYSELVRSPFRNLEDNFIEAVRKEPNPTDTEAAQALEKVNRESWDCMNRVKTELITEVSKNTVLSTRYLGQD